MANKEILSAGESESGEFTGVLENLRDLDGVRCGLQLRDRLVEENRRLILIGEPSGGKTTVISQLAYALDQKDSPVQVYVFYDQVLKRVEGKIKADDPSKVSRDMWTGNDWAQLDDTLCHAIEGTEGKRALIEIPGVSDKYGIRTRGRDAIKEIVQKSPDILVVYNVADPSTQIWGAYVRETILSTPDEEVFQILHDKFNADIVGVPEEPRYGALFKEAVRWSARREHIDAIDLEMMESARKWLLDEGNDRKLDEVKLSIESTYPYEHILGSYALENPEQVQKFVESAEYKIKLKAAYAKVYLKSVLGIDEDRGVVVFNPYSAKTRISVDAKLFVPS